MPTPTADGVLDKTQRGAVRRRKRQVAQKLRDEGASRQEIREAKRKVSTRAKNRAMRDALGMKKRGRGKRRGAPEADLVPDGIEEEEEDEGGAVVTRARDGWLARKNRRLRDDGDDVPDILENTEYEDDFEGELLDQVAGALGAVMSGDIDQDGIGAEVVATTVNRATRARLSQLHRKARREGWSRAEWREVSGPVVKAARRVIDRVKENRPERQARRGRVLQNIRDRIDRVRQNREQRRLRAGQPAVPGPGGGALVPATAEAGWLQPVTLNNAVRVSAKAGARAIAAQVQPGVFVVTLVGPNDASAVPRTQELAARLQRTIAADPRARGAWEASAQQVAVAGAIGCADDAACACRGR